MYWWWKQLSFFPFVVWGLCYLFVQGLTAQPLLGCKSLSTPGWPGALEILLSPSLRFWESRSETNPSGHQSSFWILRPKTSYWCLQVNPVHTKTAMLDKPHNSLIISSNTMMGSGSNSKTLAWEANISMYQNTGGMEQKLTSRILIRFPHLSVYPTLYCKDQRSKGRFRDGSEGGTCCTLEDMS